MKGDTPVYRWAVLWRSANALDGRQENIVWQGTQVYLFRTRLAAREWIHKEYGYIAERPDLRREPHGWKMPKAIRVRVILEMVR